MLTDLGLCNNRRHVLLQATQPFCAGEETTARTPFVQQSKHGPIPAGQYICDIDNNSICYRPDSVQVKVARAAAQPTKSPEVVYVQGLSGSRDSSH